VGRTKTFKAPISNVLDLFAGVIPEFVAKWISGHGVPPCMLCQTEEEINAATAVVMSVSQAATGTTAAQQGSSKLNLLRTRSMSISSNPLIGMQTTLSLFTPVISAYNIIGSCPL